MIRMSPAPNNGGRLVREVERQQRRFLGIHRQELEDEGTEDHARQRAEAADHSAREQQDGQADRECVRVDEGDLDLSSAPATPA